MRRARSTHPTRARIHLGPLAHNLRLLQALVGPGRRLWPAIKANAYGHDAGIVARALLALGVDTLCVSHPEEAIELLESGLRARFVVLSASLPEQSEGIVAHDLEPVVCTEEMLESLGRTAARAGRRLAVHVKVDTGMGRIGIPPEAVPAFLDRCRERPSLRVKGLMSHFARAGEADKSFSRAQLEAFDRVREATRDHGIPFHHFANSAAVFDLPESHLDASRPGVAVYGLPPSTTLANPRVKELRPVLEWVTRISFLKEVPAGVGLSYGHSFRTERPSLLATLPVGYGDGLHRGLSNRLEVLIHGRRCPQVGTITMGQCLVDVTALRGRVSLGDLVTLIGRQDDEAVTADELAARLGTINYEIVTAIQRRVPRIAVDGGDAPVGNRR
ncbi:MAG: alanine racemase [Myxococcota bacterium]|nr:alanine racemase [Myxococcota bacterium]